MADKKINLPIGAGIQVPAWATDATAEAMVLMSQRTNVVLDDMLGGVKDMKELDTQTLEAIKKTIQGVDSNQAANARAARDKAEMVLAGANHVKNVANFFGNSVIRLSTWSISRQELYYIPFLTKTKKNCKNCLKSKGPEFGQK